VFAALTGYWDPLSLALTHKGRGEVLFECSEQLNSTLITGYCFFG